MRKFFGAAYVLLLVAILTLRFWPVFPPYRVLWIAQLTVTELGALFAIPPFLYALLGSRAAGGFGAGIAIALALLPWMEAASQERNWLWNLTYGLRDDARPAPGRVSPYAGELARPLFTFREFFRLPTPARPTAETYPAGDGTRLPVLVYRPLVVEETRPRPWILSIHGGGWDGGRPSDLEHTIPDFVQAGYAVIAPGYRLAPNSIWPRQLADVEAAFAWALENAARLGLDPDQAWVLGRSAGGQLALKLAYGSRFRERIRGVVAFYAPTDLDFGYRWSLEGDVLDSRRLMEGYLGKTPDRAAAAYAEASPIHDVAAESPPTLLLYGRADPLVWYRHAERLASRLRAVGARVVQLELPWGTHGFDYFPNSPGGQIARNATLRFLEATRAIPAVAAQPRPATPFSLRK